MTTISHVYNTVYSLNDGRRTGKSTNENKIHLQEWSLNDQLECT